MRSDLPSRENWRWYISVAAVMLIAAILRVYGLRWGLPNSQRGYSYHPDEFLLIGSAVSAWKSGLPGFYNYPSLYIYISALGMAVGSGYGMPLSESNLYLTARIITMLFGVGAVAAVWWAGLRLFDRRVGLIAAIILAIAPLHVQHSHFATVDVPCTLFVALALGFCGRILHRGRMRDYVLAGIMTGLAAGTKYNAGVVIFAVVAAHVASRWVIEPRAWGRLAASMGAAALAFVISTPGMIFQWDTFKYGIKYELMHSSTGHGLVFAGTGNGFIYTFTSSLQSGLGAIAVLFAIALFWAIYRRNRAALVLLAFVIPYYVLISVSQVRFARYALPMFPAAALLVGYMLVDLSILIKNRILRIAIAVAAAAIMLLTFSFTLSLNRLFSAPDPRDSAAEWIRSHLERGTSIGVVEVPWYYSPPLAKNLGLGSLEMRREAAERAPYRFVIFSDYDQPGQWWKEDRPRWVMISRAEVGDAERIARGGKAPIDTIEQGRSITSDIAIIRKHYRRVRRFSNMWRTLPHDMSYPASDISIYELKND